MRRIGRVLWWATGVLPAWRFLCDEWSYMVAAWRWEGWGRPGDPRNDRPLLTRERWKAMRREGNDG